MARPLSLSCTVKLFKGVVRPVPIAFIYILLRRYFSEAEQIHVRRDPSMFAAHLANIGCIAGRYVSPGKVYNRVLRGRSTPPTIYSSTAI